MPLARRLHILIVASLLCLVPLADRAAGEEPLHEEQLIFEQADGDQKHVHASAIVETPGGDLRAVWYENGPKLPSSRYYNERQDKSADVRIGGSRKAKGSDTWEAPFVMSDTFGVSDNNPTMVIDADKRLWLIHSTMLGAPDWTWGSSVLRYRIASDYANPGPPRWEESNILVPHPLGFEAVIDRLAERLKKDGPSAGISSERATQYVDHLRVIAKDPVKLRLGWMPRTHPIVRSDGTLIVPLSNENFDIAMMAMTSDGGKTWSYSHPVPDSGVIQPTLVEYPNGNLQAYFRNSHPARRVQRANSTDGGITWSELELTDRLHPGGGMEALLLANGHLALVYNNKQQKPRDKLAVSISDDGGKTWKWTRQLEDSPGGRFDYPSMIQAADGSLHVTYSHHLKTIKHVHFNEAWVQAGD